MPSQKQDFSFPGHTAEELLLIAYGTFLNLGWTLKYAGPGGIIGHTPRSWSKYDDEVLVEAVDGAIAVTSSMVHNEAFDVLGKNKKHIDDFITEFDKVKAVGIKPGWAEAVTQLRQQTIIVAKEETKTSEEIDKVMKMSSGNRYVTYAIIGINVLVFIAMVFSGVNLFSPSSIDILKWGANYEPLTVSGDWWRLITSTFVHIGIIHLAFNMYALYMAGVFLEPMLGKIKYIIAYMSSGIFASIASLVWHSEPVPSAGASGAIFGIYGVFLALLLTNLIPKQMRMALLQSIGVFVVFNLVYGMRSAIDNAAHVGGLISGMVIGFVYYFSLKKEEVNKMNYPAIAIVLVTIFATWYYLDNASMSVSPERRQKVQNEITEAGAEDAATYFEKLERFSAIDSTYVAALNDNTSDEKELINRLNNLSPEWDRAAVIVEEMKNLKLSDLSKRKIELFGEYVAARKEELAAYVAYLSEKTPEKSLLFSEKRDKTIRIRDKISELE